jgi:hypothetical protein
MKMKKGMILAVLVVQTMSALYGAVYERGDNVGVNTTTPSETLDVNGTIKTSNFIVDTENNNYGGFKLDTDSSGDYHVNFRMGRNASTNNGGYRWYSGSRPSSGGDWATGTERMVLTNYGNLGIGTSTPEAKLEVVGNIGSSFLDLTPSRYTGSSGVYGEIRFWGDYKKMNSHYAAIRGVNTGGVNQNELSFLVNYGNTSKEAMRITDKGNVGIGTTEPNAKLEIVGDLGIPFLDLTPATNPGGSGVYGEIRFWGDKNKVNSRYASIRGVNTGGVDQNELSFLVNYGTRIQEAMRITDKGNVGIGTNEPSEKLEVNGNGKFSGSVFAEDWILGTEKWADFVFDEDYSLMSIKDLKLFVEEYKHLPNIPSEKTVLREGVSSKEMHINLLQTVEELTLYIFELQSQIDELKGGG